VRGRTVHEESGQLRFLGDKPNDASVVKDEQRIRTASQDTGVVLVATPPVERWRVLGSVDRIVPGGASLGWASVLSPEVSRTTPASGLDEGD
jgi:hypothetical protein